MVTCWVDRWDNKKTKIEAEKAYISFFPEAGAIVQVGSLNKMGALTNRAVPQKESEQPPVQEAL